MRWAKRPEGRWAVPTRPTEDTISAADGAELSEIGVDAGLFPLVWVDPLFAARGSSPVTVQEWSKGYAIAEEKLDVFPGSSST